MPEFDGIPCPDATGLERIPIAWENTVLGAGPNIASAVLVDLQDCEVDQPFRGSEAMETGFPERTAPRRLASAGEERMRLLVGAPRSLSFSHWAVSLHD